LILIVPFVPLQTEGFVGVNVITGFAITVIEEVVLEQFVFASVKVKVTDPAATPSTTPELETVAFEMSLDDHVPPVVGERVTVPPTQTDAGAVTTGKAFTFIGAEFAKQPVNGLVLVKNVVPAETPVTTPLAATVAIAVLLLDQVNPVPPV
jgi:hypothetical protein